MKILQLSDIHLSKNNLTNFKNYYLDALIDDLQKFNPIDVILITGDLVDKGGSSLGKKPYNQFEELFINPISNRLGIEKANILFIPGNHDINTNCIDEDNEYRIVRELDSNTANDLLEKQAKEFQKTNKRIEDFKIFEQNFHKENPSYIFTNNESLFIIESN